MEIQAALGRVQLRKLPEMNRHRVSNWRNLVAALQSHPRWTRQLEFPEAPTGAAPVWFGFPVTLADSVNRGLQDYLQALTARGVENRPVVSGNFARQPALALHGVVTDAASLGGAERLHQRGFFVGLHAHPLEDG